MKQVSQLVGFGYVDRFLKDEEIRTLLTAFFERYPMSDKRVLFIIPDSTRTAPVDRIFRVIQQLIGHQVSALDYLVALGTHPLMSEEALNRLVGVSSEERRSAFQGINIWNHRWDQPETFVEVGKISATETEELSDGRLSVEVLIRVNRLLLDYDQLIVLGPVFPHEVAGFSGGSKYFFPGVSGPEVINFTHWLGALETSYASIGVADTAVRRTIERAAAAIPVPKLALCLVTTHEGLAGIYAGEIQEAWRAAIELSKRHHIRYIAKPVQRVLSVLPEMYDDLWTGAKGMYKLEAVVADGGEIMIYAPHISEVSYTHGAMLDEIGYHVRDYFVKQWDQFKHYPWGVLAHSTHVSGLGDYVDGQETRRIKVTLATGISQERCTRLNLGYCDPKTINPAEWADRESEGVLLVPHAGEVLYRLREGED
ncbi:MAG: DUF2088 domain-containing protein, partial [Chloroflexi bacterium]|nr:DUF2088 domain-containing protein [Chloroflexota bacterium]